MAAVRPSIAPARAPRAVDLDSAAPQRGLGGLFFSRLVPWLTGASSHATPPLPTPPIFPSYTSHPHRRGCVHYGIMIPDLPAPHQFLATMTVIGSAGFRAWDDDNAWQGPPRSTVTVSHGTAATTDDPFTALNLADCDLADDGSLLRFGDALTISGIYPHYRLDSRRPGFEVDLDLTATGEITWFAKSPLYEHMSLLTRYEGTITHQGTPMQVSGLGTYEWGSGITPHNVLPRPLPARWKIPIDFFTYQVIDLDADTQLLLVGVGAVHEPMLVSAYLRTAGSGVERLGTSVRFQVLEHQNEPLTGHDGKAMAVPATFAWTIHDGARTLLELTGTVDTHLLYAAMGNIGGYRYQGRFDGRDISGRGYMEYSDRRV